MTTLDMLAPGDCGRIIRIEGHDGIAVRLREMGFVPGQVIEFLRAAPLGDPLRCLVQGSQVALRNLEARRISLERLTLGDAATEPVGEAAALTHC